MSKWDISEHLLVLIKQKAVKPGCPWHCEADTFATIRKCRAKTSVESFVPSLQWSPSRFVTRCHQEKIQNFCICHVFGVRKNRIKSAQSRHHSNLTSDVRRLFTRWRGFPQSIAQPLFYSPRVIIASCEVSIKHKTRVMMQKPPFSERMDSVGCLEILFLTWRSYN